MHNLQSKTPFSRCSRVIILMIATGFWTVDCQAQLGHVLSGVGPVDQAMAGAGTANPQDILGALHWNPASVTTFETGEFSLSPVAVSSSSLSPSALTACWRASAAETPASLAPVYSPSPSCMRSDRSSSGAAADCSGLEGQSPVPSFPTAADIGRPKLVSVLGPGIGLHLPAVHAALKGGRGRDEVAR
jgi:hypothetical protein